jgi:hypothetical protein
MTSIPTIHLDRAAVVICPLLAAGLLWLICRTGRTRDAARVVVSAPAYLVPAAMSFVLTAIFVSAFRHRAVHENPFGGGPVVNWLLLMSIGVVLAGHVGLLEARASGRPPTSDAFLRGVKRHAATLVVGKVVIAAGVALIARLVAPDRVLAIVYIVPSLFLAPLVGISTGHPGRPLAALRRCLVFAHENLGIVGRYVTAQVAFLVALSLLLGRLSGADAQLQRIAVSSSTLSYNQFPYAFSTGSPWPILVAALFSTFASAVFVTAHWLGVTGGYRRSTETAA